MEVRQERGISDGPALAGDFSRESHAAACQKSAGELMDARQTKDGSVRIREKPKIAEANSPLATTLMSGSTSLGAALA